MTERKSRIDAVAAASLVFCCFLWGLNQVAAKAILPEVPALWQAAWRSAGAVALLWLWAASRGIALWQRDGTLTGGTLAGLLFAAEFYCIFVGLQYTSASRMVVFIYTAPFSSPSACRSSRPTSGCGRARSPACCWRSPASRRRSRKASWRRRSARCSGSATRSG